MIKRKMFLASKDRYGIPTDAFAYDTMAELKESIVGDLDIGIGDEVYVALVEVHETTKYEISTRLEKLSWIEE